MKFLVETHKLLQDDHVTRPIRTPKEEELLEVHTKQYLESLSSSYNVAAITEMPFIAVMPNFLGADQHHATSSDIRPQCDRASLTLCSMQPVVR